LEYAEACDPDRIKILGVTVGPFTVGHQLLLKRIKSPFICSGDYKLADFLTALWFCSHSFAEGKRGLFRKPFGLRLWTWWMEFKINRLASGLAPVAEALADYIRLAHKPPSSFFMSSKAKRCFTPFTILYFQEAASMFGYSWDQFMDQPLRKVIYERYGLVAAQDNGASGWTAYKRKEKEETSHAE
jgi:hypothetical protein